MRRGGFDPPAPTPPAGPPTPVAARGCDVCSCNYGSVSPPTCSGQLSSCCEAVWGMGGMVIEGPLSPPDLALA